MTRLTIELAPENLSKATTEAFLRDVVMEKEGEFLDLSPADLPVSSEDASMESNIVKENTNEGFIYSNDRFCEGFGRGISKTRN